MLDLKKIETPSFFTKETLQNSWKALVMLLFGIVLSIAASCYLQLKNEQQTASEFNTVCIDIKVKISSELHLYAQLLRSSAALFTVSDTISRNTWKTFVQASKSEKNLPQIQGLGFSVIVPKNELQQHIYKIRQQGYPNYTIYPAGNRNLYTSIIFLEPFSGSNLKAFGFDMFSEHVRKKAMEYARDEDEATLSGKVHLVQEAASNIQPGTLMYVPVYQKGMPTSTISERRAAIRGWVYSPYRMIDLMQRILGRWDLIEANRIHLQVYDDSIAAKSFLYDSQSIDPIISIKYPYHSISMPLTFNGTKWVLVFTQYGAQIPYYKTMSFIVLLSGITISISLFLFFISVINTRRRALQIADDLSVVLKENVERYKNLSNLLESMMDAVPGLIFYKDKKNNFVKVNDAIARAHGKTKAEMEGKSLFDLYPKEAATKYYQDDMEVINSGISKLNIEERWETTAGIKWLITSKIPFVNTAGQIIGVIGMSMDITERKQLEIEREQFLKFFQISPDIMVIADPNGCFKKINPACLQLLGYTEAELMAKPFIDFVHPDERQATLNEMTNQIKTGISINFENRYICKDGTTKILSWRATYLNNDGLTYATARDITLQKETEKKIQEMNKELDKKVIDRTYQYEMVNKELDAFTFSISHDLRAPLRAINSYAQILQEDYAAKINTDGLQMLENIKHNGIKMGRLIDDLLAFSRLGRKELVKKPVNMNELTQLVLADINKDFPNHANIQVANLPEAQGDHRLLYQAMYNLVANAIKYSFKKQNPMVAIDTLQEDSKNIYYIKDNGAGFDMRFSAKLFGVFQRLHSEEEFEGNGVGLAIVQRIIQKHGGKVWGEGKVNEGATFYFTLN